jgi:NAD(P)-dependent dehydrogenase (short-subunit alcohol dehydrogenase family)
VVRKYNLTFKNMFKNKVAIVTGAASGIGKATAIKFAALGARVVVMDMNESAGKALVESIGKKAGSALFVSCNVCEEPSVIDAMDRVISVYGRIDYAYNNAGVGGEFAKVENYPTDDWDKVMAVNLRGVFLCMKHQIPFMLQQEKAAIVNCASLLSTVAYENDSAYVASKFAVLGLTKNAALEYASTGLRINSVSPGFTRTPMIDKGDEKKLTHIAAKHPIGRLANPEEIAEGVIWLCSDQSSFAIGLNLVLDGGYTLQ